MVRLAVWVICPKRRLTFPYRTSTLTPNLQNAAAVSARINFRGIKRHGSQRCHVLPGTGPEASEPLASPGSTFNIQGSGERTAVADFHWQNEPGERAERGTMNLSMHDAKVSKKHLVGSTESATVGPKQGG